MKKLKPIILIVISLVVLIVVLQNTKSVETRFLFISVTMPRALLLFLTFLFGFIAGAISTVSITKKQRGPADA